MSERSSDKPFLQLRLPHPEIRLQPHVPGHPRSKPQCIPFAVSPTVCQNTQPLSAVLVAVCRRLLFINYVSAPKTAMIHTCKHSRLILPLAAFSFSIATSILYAAPATQPFVEPFDNGTLPPVRTPTVAPASRPSLQVNLPSTRPFVESFEIGNKPLVIAPTTGPATRPLASTTQPSKLAAEPFSGPSAGISFHPPAGLKEIPTSGAVEQIVSYSNRLEPGQKETTTLVVSRVIPGKPTPLVAPRKSERGMLDIYENELSTPPMSATILRSDTMNAGKDGSVNVGMLACRYTAGPQRFLRQRAVVEGALAPNERGEKVGAYFYVFDYTIPTSKAKDDVDDSENKIDPDERAAVETFRQLLDSIELVDLQKINKEVTERLFRTRTLLVNLTPHKIQATVVPQRVCLIIQNGKEIGYSYVEQSWEPRESQEGFVVSMRICTFPATGDRTEAVAEMFCTADRKYESWVSVAYGEKDVKKDGKSVLQRDELHEVGFLAHEQTRVLDERDGTTMQPKDHVDAKQPPVRIIDHNTLTVQQHSTTTKDAPVEREVPPYYIPQAFSQMLPQLLPLTEAKSYCFAAWVGGDRREVMRRFVDVELERKVNLRGQSVRVIPVKDRIGYEGQPTYHYFSLQGRYLGSVNESAGKAIFVSDPDTVKDLCQRNSWPAPDFSAPHILKKINGGFDEPAPNGKLPLPIKSR